MNQLSSENEPASDPRPRTAYATIWTEPRGTLRRLLQQPEPDKYFLLFLWPIAINQTLLELLVCAHQGVEFSPFTIMMIFLGSIIVWLIGMPFAALMLQAGGRLFGGKASGTELRLVVAWGCLPMAIFLPLWIPLWLIYGFELYEPLRGTPASMQHMQAVLFFIFFLNAVLSIWGMVILAAGITEVQRYSSVWMGFVNLVAANVVLLGLGLALLKAVDIAVAPFMG